MIQYMIMVGSDDAIEDGFMHFEWLIMVEDMVDDVGGAFVV